MAVLLGVFGVVGMTATANVAPVSASCNCIPSPAARFQELSVIMFAFGVALVPVGWWMSRTTTVAANPSGVRSAGAYSGGLMRSSEYFFLGVALVVFGVCLVTVPSFLVLGNRLLELEGVATIAFGIVLAYRGGQSR